MKPSTQTVAQRNSTGMLVALGALGKHIYEGTVSPGVKADRRGRNKAARAARKAARR